MVDHKPEALRVRMLGGFSVGVGFRTIGQDEWHLRRAAALIKLLALAPNHRLHREQSRAKPSSNTNACGKRSRGISVWNLAPEPAFCMRT